MLQITLHRGKFTVVREVRKKATHIYFVDQVGSEGQNGDAVKLLRQENRRLAYVNMTKEGDVG
jgi:hypothetical protein